MAEKTSALRFPKDPPNWKGGGEPVWRRGLLMVLKLAHFWEVRILWVEKTTYFFGIYPMRDPWEDCIFTYMNGWVFMANVGKYTRHYGSQGHSYYYLKVVFFCFFVSRLEGFIVNKFRGIPGYKTHRCSTSCWMVQQWDVTSRCEFGQWIFLVP